MIAEAAMTPRSSTIPVATKGVTDDESVLEEVKDSFAGDAKGADAVGDDAGVDDCADGVLSDELGSGALGSGAVAA